VAKKKRKKNGTTWYHASDYDGTEFLKVAPGEDPPHTSESYAWFGPFDSFGECKTDAIGYHRASVDRARASLHGVKQTRAREYK
jgi:hypothetical protein